MAEFAGVLRDERDVILRLDVEHPCPNHRKDDGDLDHHNHGVHPCRFPDAADEQG